MAIFPSTAIPSGAEAFTIDQSLRFNDDDSAYLSRTPSSASNRKTWTYSVWFKIGVLLTSGNTYNRTLLSDSNAGDMISIATTGSGTGEITIDLCGANQKGTMMLRDSSAWYHLVVAMDTANASDALRKRVWLNGESLASQYTVLPSQDAEGDINNTVEHTIGKQGGQTRYFDGYMAEIHLIDGTALTPSSFGETGTYGEWKAKEYDVADGAYGTNGFYLSFAGGGTMSATGGTITTDGDYKVNSFTASGTFTPSADGYVEYLVIAGGGSGGQGYRLDGVSRSGGGGGAGGYRTGYLAVTGSTAYSITVGAGGAAVAPNPSSGANPGLQGSNSVFSTITSTGGGGGGSGHGGAPTTGGSGGGGAHHDTSGGAATAGQGNAGGRGYENPGYHAGGGGGAGAVGVDGVDGSSNGAGGVGLASSITGSAVTRAGGGGGGGSNTDGVGGSGGGTAGDEHSDATANTGSGGGGAGNSNGSTGAGGSGIVIIRYKFQ